MKKKNREKNNNGQQDSRVRSANDVDNKNRIDDRNTNTATASVQDSGNSTVNVNINIGEEDEAGGAPGQGAYPPVSITNSTPFSAFGEVNYASFLCSDDRYNVAGNGSTWTASSRGVCLLTRITAIVRTPSGDIAATPYTSSGTSYSEFVIIQTGPNQFAVTRRVS